MSHWHSRTRRLVSDSLFLTVILLLSVALYADGLGFYYDDWSLLGYMHTAGDRSLSGLVHTLYSFFPHVHDRPVQALYFAALYWLFGDTPGPYHMTNALVFSAGILMFAVALQALLVPRMLALAVPLIYALLPNYSTNRFWYAAFAGNLAMLMYFLSLWSQARALRSDEAWRWQTVSFISLLVCGLSYEVFLPLFLINPVVAWFVGRRTHVSLNPRFPWRILAITGGAIIALAAVKTLTSVRFDGDTTFAHHLYLNYWMFSKVLRTNYLQHGFGLPLLGWKALYLYPDRFILTLGVAIAVMVFWYLHRLGRDRDIRLLGFKTTVWLGAAGLAVCLAGYAVFMFNYMLTISPTGDGNRTAIAGSLGVALTLVAVASGVSALWPWDAARRASFAALIAMLSGAGFVVNNTLASFWVDAYEETKEVMVGLRQLHPDAPPASTLLVDGLCLYRGPAMVFTQSWDVTGALMMLYKRRDIKGDVVLPYTDVGEKELSINESYPYASLYLYNHRHKKIFELADAETARGYFQTFNPDYTNGCPPFDWGHGVSVF